MAKSIMGKVKRSKAQKEHRERFKLAMAEREVRTAYENMAAKEHQGPSAMAFYDYLNGNDLLAKK